MTARADEHRMERKVIVWTEETSSTNDMLRQRVDAGEHIDVLATRFQTAGRGQGGNKWESERGKNLLFSLCVQPQQVSAREQYVLSMAVAVGMVNGLRTLVAGAGELKVKWPNDIYVDHHKLSGILIENRLRGTQIAQSIVGIGLNVNQQVFVSDAPNPVSLRQLTGRDYDVEKLLENLTETLFDTISQTETENGRKQLRQTYQELLYRRGQMAGYADAEGTFRARIHHVEDDGHLVMTDEQGRERRYAFKEVTFNIKYNPINKRTMEKRFNRILLKLSGESLMGKQSYGIDPERLADYARQIKEVHDMGVQIGIVIGGGNIFRGLSGSQKGFDRVKGDQMGMCATVINSLALSSALGAIGVKNKVMTAIRMEPIGEFYTKWKAIEAMEQGQVCIFSAGTGSPYFTTDTGSSLRGIEIEADVMLKGTRVDGIYTADPEKDPTATKFEEITYKEVLARGLKVMDLTAICMCQDNNLPIYVFNMDIVGNLKRVMAGENIGTLVHN